MSEESKESRTQQILPSWPDIKVILEIPSGIVPNTNLTDQMVKQFEDNPPGTEGIRPFAYFKFKDGFDKVNSLILKVRYTPSAWKASTNPEKPLPWLFYRGYDDIKNIWVGDWMRIMNAEPTEPTDDDPFYYLTVENPDIPDPAIGGC